MFFTQKTQKLHRNFPKIYWDWAKKENPFKAYYAVYIRGKKGCGTIAEKPFFNSTLSNTINLTDEKLSASYLLVDSQSLFKFGQIIRTSFIKLLLFDYAVYGTFVWKNFVIFDRLSLK